MRGQNMDLKEVIEKSDGGLHKKVVKENPSTFRGPKAKARLLIQEQVFDIYDSIADNAKMISLILSLLWRIYEALPEESKVDLLPQDRYLIEYAFERFKNIQTRADVQFKREGVALIDKLLERQGKIGELVEKTIYGGQE